MTYMVRCWLDWKEADCCLTCMLDEALVDDMFVMELSVKKENFAARYLKSWTLWYIAVFHEISTSVVRRGGKPRACLK